jgi:hypothetical protein
MEVPPASPEWDELVIACTLFVLAMIAFWFM